MHKFTKIIYLVIIVATLGAVFVVSIAPYIEARRTLQSYSDDRDLFFLNYYANMRFILAKMGITSENFIQEKLRERHKIFYLSVLRDGFDEQIKPYADYLYYIMPHEEDKKINIRKTENRELFTKAITVIKAYSSVEYEVPFVKRKAFEQLARTYNFINRFGVNSFANTETNISLSKDAWRGLRNLSQEIDLKEDNVVSLYTVFYWNLVQNSGETLLRIADGQSVCSHSFLPVYKEIRAPFYQNSLHMFKLLVRDGVFSKTANIESAIQSKTTSSVDELIRINCKAGDKYE